MDRWLKIDKRWKIGVGILFVMIIDGMFWKVSLSTSDADFLVETQTSTSLNGGLVTESTSEMVEQVSSSVEVIAYADIKGAVNAWIVWLIGLFLENSLMTILK